MSIKNYVRVKIRPMGIDVNKQNSLTGSVFSAKLGLDWDQPSPIAGFSKKNHTLDFLKMLS